MKKVLAVIPARKGSKRIKNKNLLLLNGKPLIYYTIKAAKESKYIDDWLVSSDSDEIIKIAKFFKAERCIIYTDVEGVYTTDPNKLKNAKK